MLWGIFRTGWEGVEGDWRKLHDEELNDFYCSLNVVRVTQSRMLKGRGVWHIWSRRGMHTEFL
jgi:hypothetical protein